MVRIEDRSGELVFTVKDNRARSGAATTMLRITPDAMAELEALKRQTGLPLARLASELIMFGSSHYSIEIEED